MHWATPKTDRMIKGSTSNANQSLGSSNPFRKSECLPTQNPFNKEYDPSFVQSKHCVSSQSKGKDEDKSPHEISLDSDSRIEIEIHEEKENLAEDNTLIGADEADDGVTYEPTQYDTIPYRMESPPPEWKRDEKVEIIKEQLQKSSHALDSNNETANAR